MDDWGRDEQDLCRERGSPYTSFASRGIVRSDASHPHGRGFVKEGEGGKEGFETRKPQSKPH